MLRTPGMTIGQGQQGLDAMGQALTSILQKLDDELLKIGPKSHIHHIHWFSFKETNENLAETMVCFPCFP